MDLQEWLFKFVEYKNSFLKEKPEVERYDKGVIVKKNSSQVKYEVEEPLATRAVFEKVDVIVCLNNKRNVLFLESNWETFKSLDVSLLFVNPKTQEHWQIKPKFHDLVADRKELKTGLLSLMEGITIYE